MASHIMPEPSHVAINILYLCDLFLHLPDLVFQQGTFPCLLMVLYLFLKQYDAGDYVRKHQGTDNRKPKADRWNGLIDNNPHPVVQRTDDQPYDD